MTSKTNVELTMRETKQHIHLYPHCLCIILLLCAQINIRIASTHILQQKCYYCIIVVACHKIGDMLSVRGGSVKNILPVRG